MNNFTPFFLLCLLLSLANPLLAQNDCGTIPDCCEAMDAAGIATCAAGTATTIILTSNNQDIDVTSPADLDLRGVTLLLRNNSITLPPGTQVDAGTSFDAGGNDGVSVTVGANTFTFTNNSGDLANLNAAIAGGATTLEMAVNVLPVELISFTAEAMEKKVMLHWTTARESENESFDLAVSYDGRNFVSIQTIAGRGNADDSFTYEVSDVPTLSGTVHYRLTQRDFGGLTTELGIRAVRWTTAGQTGPLTVSPNPVGVGRSITLRGSDAGASLLDVLSINGRLLRQLPLTDGTALLPADVPTGVYLLRVDGGTGAPVRLVVR